MHQRTLVFMIIIVVCFPDILRTFMKFVIILLLFVMAFAMAFYALLMNQVGMIFPILVCHYHNYAHKDYCENSKTELC